MAPARFLNGHPDAAAIHEEIANAIAQLGDVTTTVQKSQIRFSRAHPFAAVWIPAKYLRGATAPLVLTVFANERLSSTRWKEVVEPAAGRFTHHLELRAKSDVDAEVKRWLERAWRQAGG